MQTVSVRFLACLTRPNLWPRLWRQLADARSDRRGDLVPSFAGVGRRLEAQRLADADGDFAWAWDDLAGGEDFERALDVARVDGDVRPRDDHADAGLEAPGLAIARAGALGEDDQPAMAFHEALAEFVEGVRRDFFSPQGQRVDERRGDGGHDGAAEEDVARRDHVRLEAHAGRQGAGEGHGVGVAGVVGAEDERRLRREAFAVDDGVPVVEAEIGPHPGHEEGVGDGRGHALLAADGLHAFASGDGEVGGGLVFPFPHRMCSRRECVWIMWKPSK